MLSNEPFAAQTQSHAHTKHASKTVGPYLKDLQLKLLRQYRSSYKNVSQFLAHNRTVRIIPPIELTDSIMVYSQRCGMQRLYTLLRAADTISANVVPVCKPLSCLCLSRRPLVFRNWENTFCDALVGFEAQAERSSDPEGAGEPGHKVPQASAISEAVRHATDGHIPGVCCAGCAPHHHTGAASCFER